MQTARVTATGGATTDGTGTVAGAWRDASATVVQLCVTAKRLPDDLPALRTGETPGRGVEAVAVTASGSGGTASSLRLVYPPTTATGLVLSGALARGRLVFPALARSTCPSPPESGLVACPGHGWLRTVRWDTGIRVSGTSTRSLVAELTGVPVGGPGRSVAGALVVGTRVVEGRVVLDVAVMRDELREPTRARLRLTAVYDFAHPHRKVRGRLPSLSPAFDVEPVS
jgi:hypothetical protein